LGVLLPALLLSALLTAAVVHCLRARARRERDLILSGYSFEAEHPALKRAEALIRELGEKYELQRFPAVP